MIHSNQEIFISYAWGGESEKIAEQLEKVLQEGKRNVIRDKKDMHYKGNIDEFERRIGKGDYIIVILSDRYLKSEHCMNEILHIERKENVYDRIFPIVLDDAKIYSDFGRLDYTTFWQEKEKNFKEKLKEIGAEVGMTRHMEDLNKIADIKRIIGEIIAIFAKMNTLTVKTHKHNDFSQLLDTINQRILETSLEINREKKVVNVIGELEQGSYISFKNRKKILSQITNTLSGKHKIVMLIGKGGMGKSALTKRVLEAIEKRQQVDGIVLLSTEGSEKVTFYNIYFHSVECLCPAKKQYYESLWISNSQKVEQLIESLIDIYREKSVVIVMDGFESILDKNGRVLSEDINKYIHKLLTTTHKAKLLITTRESIFVEPVMRKFRKVFELDEGLPTDDAIDLLLELTSTANINLPNEKDNLKRLVEGVNGIPLALEYLSSYIEDEIEFDEKALKKDVLNTINEWMVSRLDEKAKMVLQIISIFDEPISVECLTYMLTPYFEEFDLTPALKYLINSRLVKSDAKTSKMYLHKINKDYHYSEIKDNSSDKYNYRVLHRRAASFFENQYINKENWYEWEDYDALKPVRNRFYHLKEIEDYTEAIKSFSASSIEFLDWHGHLKDVKSLIDLEINKNDNYALILQKYAIADIASIEGPFNKSKDEFTEIIEMAKELNDPLIENSARSALGLVLRYLGKSQEAVSVLREAFKIYRERNATRTIAIYLYGYSLACTYAGLYEEALETGNEQLRIGIAEKDSFMIAKAHNNLCLTYYVTNQFKEAEMHALDSIKYFKNTPHEYAIGFVYNVLGMALHAQDKIKNAQEAYSSAKENGNRYFQARAVATAEYNQAWLSYVNNQNNEALQNILNCEKRFVDQTNKN